MAMTNDQQQFLDDFQDNFNLKYPARYIAGVRKYKSTIHKDYTVEEHLNNIEEELMDGLAYLHAVRLIYREQQNGKS